MQKAPIPTNEKERLCVVEGLKILDSATEERFDVITKKIHTLLKKNLDQIYNIYKKNRKVYSRNITDYDLPVPFNGYGKGTTDKSFEYI